MCGVAPLYSRAGGVVRQERQKGERREMYVNTNKNTDTNTNTTTNTNTNTNANANANAKIKILCLIAAKLSS